MYVPEHFAVKDPEAILAFIRREPFALLVSARDGDLRATHVPFVILQEQPLKLGLHVARANPHWRELDGERVLAIFQGAHGRVSASWYADPKHTVPTWNYSAVHCSGRATVTDAAGTDAIVRAVAATHDPEWRIGDADPQYIEQMEKNIVGIEIAVERIDAAFKHSQNRSAEDFRRVTEALSNSTRSGDRDLAADMLRSK